MENKVVLISIDGVSILDAVPTAVDVMGIPAPEEWEGKSVLK